MWLHDCNSMSVNRPKIKRKWRAGILGATGVVGQRLVHLLTDHPWFEVTEVAASERSAGKKYAEAAQWRLEMPIPPGVGDLVVQDLSPKLDCDLVFSALDSTVAGPAEEEFARAGYPVVSNSRNHRMDGDVPLVIPEVNAAHLEVIEQQKKRHGTSRGFMITNPNCSTAGLALALKPIQDAFGISEVFVVTLQAISGAGHPGVASLDIYDNVIPFISGEEEKLECEPLKILGTLSDNQFLPASMRISAQCNRVPVIDGHLECVSLRLRSKASPAEVSKALQSFEVNAQLKSLPSALLHPIIVREECDRPQSRLDRNAGNGYAAVVGRVRSCPIFDIKFVLLSHNLVRGAAGAALLNAELLAAHGFLN